jgi:hypothetical protein
MSLLLVLECIGQAQALDVSFDNSVFSDICYFGETLVGDEKPKPIAIVNRRSNFDPTEAAKREIVVSTGLTPDALPVRADPIHMQQVLLNLGDERHGRHGRLRAETTRLDDSNLSKCGVQRRRSDSHRFRKRHP